MARPLSPATKSQSRLPTGVQRAGSQTKVLLVTCSVDLGSSTLATNFETTLKMGCDLTRYDFARKDRKRFRNGRLDWIADIAGRGLRAPGLWRAMWRARLEGRTIIVLGSTPALYGAAAACQGDTMLITDWTKKLYEPIVPGHHVAAPITRLQSMAFRRYALCVALTSAVQRSLASDYDVAPDRLVRCAMPLLPLRRTDLSQSTERRGLRILFVGGDFWRKGGAILLDWASSRSLDAIHIDIVTRSVLSVEHPNIDVHPDVSYRDATYMRLFSEADVFVLPTKFDAYPMALGEALAAGLALVVDRRALGATEVVEDGANGFITGSDDACLHRLDDLVRNPTLVARMKARSRAIYSERFSPAVTSNRLQQLIASRLRSGVHEGCSP